jgi:hypothetical protein
MDNLKLFEEYHKFHWNKWNVSHFGFYELEALLHEAYERGAMGGFYQGFDAWFDSLKNDLDEIDKIIKNYYK